VVVEIFWKIIKKIVYVAIPLRFSIALLRQVKFLN